MPTKGYSNYDPEQYQAARRQIEKDLVAKGLTPGTRKFGDVFSRKLRRWNHLRGSGGSYY